nr:hypothetical protein [Trentepohlia sp. YN1317]
MGLLQVNTSPKKLLMLVFYYVLNIELNMEIKQKSNNGYARRNQNKMIYKTRWKNLIHGDYVYIEPKTPFLTIIEILEKTAKTKYSPHQMSALKQFYYNKKGPNGEPKKKIAFDWYVEYLVNNEYV